ncbi:hypothetical protein WA158_007034 [Blastocystis sp. Blastoise]
MLANKVSAVFGVANKYSIAWEVAKNLRKQGSHVAIVYQNERFKQGIEKMIEKEMQVDDKSPYLLLQCDVTDKKQIDDTCEQIQDKYKKLDFLFHSIAHAPSSCLKKPLSEMTEEEFLETQKISSYSLISLIHAYKPLLNQSLNPSVCTLSFIGGERVYPNYAPMGPAKATLECLVKYLATEMGPKNIRVNCIRSAPISTVAAKGLQGFNEMKNTLKSIQPLSYDIIPQYVANTAVFLASDLSLGITGDIIHVDGGQHLR